MYPFLRRGVLQHFASSHTCLLRKRGLFPFSSGAGHFSVDCQTLQASHSPLGTCVGFSHSQNLWGGGVLEGVSVIHSCISPSSICSLNPNSHVLQSSWLFQNGLICTSHIPSHVFWHPKSACESCSQVAPIALRDCSCWTSPAFLCVMLSPASPSCWFPWNIYEFLCWDLSQLNFIRPHCYKVKTFGDGKSRKERLVPRERNREQVYCLGFLPLGNHHSTASPERALSS